MASSFSSQGLIADRYASALFDVSSKSKCVDKILTDFSTLEEYIKNNKDFNLLIKSPLIASNEKLLIIEKLMKNNSANILTQTFIKVIAQNKRISNLHPIILRFRNIDAEKRGDIIATVISAGKLTEKQKEKIKLQLKSSLGENLSINYEVDKKIIGGLIVKVGSRMIDSSLETKINKIKIAMKGA